jgi:PII-like signaling protein
MVATGSMDAGTHGAESEQVLLRIIVSESRTHGHRPVFRALLETLRDAGLGRAVVFKGAAGFGHDRSVHTVALEVAAQGLPIVIEVVDTRERIESVMPRLEPLLEGGVVMLERAHVVRPAPRPASP